MRVVLKLLGAGCALLLVGLCATSNLGNAPGRRERVARNRADVESVIAALEAHRARSGVYPHTLDELVPGALAALPAMKTTEGSEPDPSRLVYAPAADRASYELSYPVEPIGTLPSDAFNAYTSGTRSWTVRE